MPVELTLVSKVIELFPKCIQEWYRNTRLRRYGINLRKMREKRGQECWLVISQDPDNYIRQRPWFVKAKNYGEFTHLVHELRATRVVISSSSVDDPQLLADVHGFHLKAE